MSELKDTITVRVNVKITPESLKTIVENAKKDVGMDQRGVYRVDTAGKVDEMISQFLLEKDPGNQKQGTPLKAEPNVSFAEIFLEVIEALSRLFQRSYKNEIFH
ncbi:MAG: hypothetical protein JRG77_04380 [Deltaproteobacteria bacterium]|nr:hypothetical protein [Deltaproteobacteria bacterium]